MIIFQQYNVSHSNYVVVELLILSCDTDDSEYCWRHFTFRKLWMPDATHSSKELREHSGKSFWVNTSYSCALKHSTGRLPRVKSWWSTKASMIALTSWERWTFFFHVLLKAYFIIGKHSKSCSCVKQRRNLVYVNKAIEIICMWSPIPSKRKSLQN